MKLTEDEVIQILRLVEESRFDELQLEVADIKLHVRKRGRLTVPVGGCNTEVSPQTELSPRAVTEARTREPSKRAQEAESTGTIVRDDRVNRAPAEKALIIPEEGAVPIKAPMLGTFYARPSPEAPPYAEVGTLVKEEDSVCLLEVMKVFSSVKAGVRGYITKVCAKTGDMVEFGQILFLVKPVDA